MNNEWYIKMAKFSRLPDWSQKEHSLDQFIKNDGNDKGLEAVQELINGKLTIPFILFVGTNGLGKTFLAHAAGWSFINKGQSVLFYRASEFLDELREAYQIETLAERAGDFFEYRKSRRLMNMARNYQLLILDDLGAHNTTDWAAEKLDMIIDQRYEDRSPTLVTTNIADNRLSERILDRMKQGRVVLLKGKSWRSEKR
jgi:DNA replication protein DnaC